MQPTLFDLPAPPLPAAIPHNGSVGSRNAAATLTAATVSGQAAKALQAIQAAPAGLIREEVQAATGLPCNVVSRACNGLLRAGLVIERGERKSGRGIACAVLVAR